MSSAVSSGKVYLKMPDGGCLDLTSCTPPAYWELCYRDELTLTNEDVSNFWTEAVLADSDLERQDRVDQILWYLCEQNDATIEAQRQAGQDTLERTSDASTNCRKTFVSETKQRFDIFNHPGFKDWFNLPLLSKHFDSLGTAAKIAIRNREYLWDSTAESQKGAKWVEAIQRLRRAAQLRTIHLCQSRDLTVESPPEGAHTLEYKTLVKTLKQGHSALLHPKRISDFMVEEAEALAMSESDGRWEAPDPEAEVEPLASEASDDGEPVLQSFPPRSVIGTTTSWISSGINYWLGLDQNKHEPDVETGLELGDMRE